MKHLVGLATAITVVITGAVPLSASADTMSVSQVITITAQVAPMRSIVVNDQGQMTRIYSNTSDNITPKVYRNKAPGPELALTPALQQQYDQIMSRPGNKVGVAIDVPLPAQPNALDTRLRALLPATASIMTRTLFHL